MNIDWDEVVQEADDSPRSILAECLAKCDEFSDVIVIAMSPDDKGNYVRHWLATASTERAVAMLELTKFGILREVNETA